MSPILPGATIGILGGGQLGRMAAMAARTLGYSIHALDPDPECSAKPVVDRLVTARFDDAEAAVELARFCDVVTLEIEQIATAGLDAAARHVPVRPGAAVLGVIQDRAQQKRWLASHGFPLGAYRDATTEEALASAVRELGASFAKATRGGYDGRSQLRIPDVSATHDAWIALRGTDGRPRPLVVEQALDLEAELSVMVARRPSGEMLAYSPALNFHERQVLSWSVIPAPLPMDVIARAEELARGIAEQLHVEGLLAVEMFLVRDGRLLVNELAPRPHNSYHETELACATSQFEQLARAVCDIPLGDPKVLRPAAIVNLFGDLWLNGPLLFDRALEVKGSRLHLYGKKEARAGRKMGHISAVGRTPEEALARARDAAARLTNSQ